MTKANRHRRALFVSLVVLAIAAAPLYLLWKVRSDDILAGMGDYGHVPEFLYVVENGGVGYSHFDTMKHISVLYLMRAPSPAAEAEARAAMAGIQDYVKTQLVSRDDTREKPPAIKAFLMAAAWEGDLPEGWGYIKMGPGVDWLTPPAWKDDARNALVVIDDAGRYRAYLPAGEPEGVTKVERMLSKIASQQNLLFYLTNQTLMWEKAKRVARGLEPYPGS